MNVVWNLRTILILAGIVVILIGTNVGQAYLYWAPKQENMRIAYEQQVAGLQARLDQIGPMVGIWGIRDDLAGVEPGDQIEMDHLTVKEIPESVINRSFILDPEPVIGQYYKLALDGGALMTWDLVMEEPLEDSTREYDIIANVMPIGLKEGDYVDFRIVYPMGEDYIVLPHKRVESINGETIKMHLNETEIHIYQSALLDYFIQSRDGSMLYMTKYLEPGVQEPAERFYAVPSHILNLMEDNPNIRNLLHAELNQIVRSELQLGEDSRSALSSISSGRSQIMSKINSGTNDYERRLDELEDQLGNLNEAQNVQETPNIQAPAEEEEIPGVFQIEEGVVE